MIALDSGGARIPWSKSVSNSVADADAAIGFATFYDPGHAGTGTTLTAVALSNDGNYLLAKLVTHGPTCCETSDRAG